MKNFFWEELSLCKCLPTLLVNQSVAARPLPQGFVWSQGWCIRSAHLLFWVWLLWFLGSLSHLLMISFLSSFCFPLHSIFQSVSCCPFLSVPFLAFYVFQPSPQCCYPICSRISEIFILVFSFILLVKNLFFPIREDKSRAPWKLTCRVPAIRRESNIYWASTLSPQETELYHSHTARRQGFTPGLFCARAGAFPTIPPMLPSWRGQLLTRSPWPTGVRITSVTAFWWCGLEPSASREEFLGVSAFMVRVTGGYQVISRHRVLCGRRLVIGEVTAGGG